MEYYDKSEKLPPINYLERDINISITFDKEVIQWLPHITREDIKVIKKIFQFS